MPPRSATRGAADAAAPDREAAAGEDAGSEFAAHSEETAGAADPDDEDVDARAQECCEDVEMVTVAAGRTLHHDGVQYGPGRILEVFSSEARYLRRIGAAVDPKAKPAEAGIGPNFGGNPERVTLK